MTSLCLLLIAVGFAIACPMTALMRRLGTQWGALDHPGERKLHERPIPATGGVAIFAALVSPIAAGLLAAWVLPDAWWRDWAPPIAPHLEGIRAQTPMALGLLAGTTALHIVGLIDDRRNLGPMLKLAVQALAAIALVGLFDVRLLSLLGPVGSIAITVLWFLVITNAFNFLDNMDGLSAGVAAIGGGMLLAAALINGQWFVAAVLGLLVGGLLGFLVFNYPPAGIFMGDGGSLVVGFVTAFCAVRTTYYDPALSTHWWAVFTPVVVLAIPLYDLLSVTLIRISQGRSPFVGDTQHFSHRLVRKGLTRPAAVGVIWACTLATGLGGVMLGRLSGWQAALVIVQTLAVLSVLALLERTRNTAEAAPATSPSETADTSGAAFTDPSKDAASATDPAEQES